MCMACITPRGKDGQLAYHHSSSPDSASSSRTSYSPEGKRAREYNSAGKDYN